MIASFYPPRGKYRMIAKEQKKCQAMKTNQDYCSLSALCVAVQVISTASARLSRVAMSCSISLQSRISRKLDPADPPPTAVPETLCHPFATAKIVVWTRTRSVRGGPIAVRRDWGNATLCACGRSSERTGNCCGRNKSRSCLLHSRPSCACMACGHADCRTTNDATKFPPLHVTSRASHCIRSS